MSRFRYCRTPNRPRQPRHLTVRINIGGGTYLSVETASAQRTVTWQ